MADPEKANSPTAETAGGYPLLADFMTWIPRFAIMPRFRSMNVLRLLLLQGEITKHEEIVKSWTVSDAASGDSQRLSYSLDAEVLQNLDDDDPRSESLQELRKKLKEYSTFML